MNSTHPLALDCETVEPANIHGSELRPVTAPVRERVRVGGKFLFAGDEKFWVKGVTYGTFCPDAEGSQFPPRDVVLRDFAAMAERGFNALRTYTVPPRWLLDEAARNGLRVMVGLPWEQHVTFLDNAALRKQIEQGVRDSVRACAGHPAVLCFSLGNEIPPTIVRWHGRRAIERFLHRLYRIAKAADPDALVTYVNFPTTEYLQLSFLDFICFNVYLESPDRLAAYLARLQNIAGEKPLLMAEIGLDSRRNGEQLQAESLGWQVRTAFTSGCTGAFVFAWTDEWYRGGATIDDWDFGLTTRTREPKPALHAVQEAFAAVPFAAGVNWPRISVVVCSYNGAATIRDTMEGLQALAYPDYEVIVVNDGSTDATPDIVAEYDCRLISTENRGLSNARNTGWQVASGEIVAYIDDDAYPDPHWLHYLAHTFMTTDYVGVGGPNIAPAGGGDIADCVANAPGGPVHVLVSDSEAEHIPGCNMAFRRDALAAIDGFDARYRAAGDDVDLCWRLQDQVGKIGFNAAAMDWHHRRNSLHMYWKQQQGYGKAEALLEEKWPEKYNWLGHLAWSGRLYGKGLTDALPLQRSRVYQGQWGQALFQSIYQPAPGHLISLPLMPEWFLLAPVFGLLGVLGLGWSPLLWAFPLALAVLLLPLVQAIFSAAKASFPTARSPWHRLKLYALTAVLHYIQPIARLKGRLQHGLTPGRRRGRFGAGATRPPVSLWSERHRPSQEWMESLEATLRADEHIVRRGNDYDRWDLAIADGPGGGARLRVAIEEHGQGRQLVHFACQPVPGRFYSFCAVLALGLGLLALFDDAPVVGGILIAAAALTAASIVRSIRRATRELAGAAQRLKSLAGVHDIET